MKCLLLADKSCGYLSRRLLEEGSEYLKADFIFALGDLHPEYISFIADASRKSVFYVEGNHHFLTPFKLEELKKEHPYMDKHIVGGVNMNKRLLREKDIYICGFSDSIQYNMAGGQSSESRMFVTVFFMTVKVFLRRIWDVFRKKPKAPLFVLSHSPAKGIGDREDRPHRGFRSFLLFQKLVKPDFWFYGHVHLKDFREQENIHYKGTTFINSYEFKTLELNENQWKVDFRFN